MDVSITQPATDLAARLGRVAVIGAGRMGQAICTGLAQVDGLDPANVTVANPGAAKRELVERSFGMRTVEAAPAALPADTVIFAVKPAKVVPVALSLAQAGLSDALVVSIAAGISTASIEAALGPGARVVRAMPNTPLVVGAGVTGVSAGHSATSADVELACGLFSLLGTAIVVDEGHLDAVTALSGSGPAYFETFARAMVGAGEDLGLDATTARELVLHTMLGTASMLNQTGQDLTEAIEAVSSPGGTTLAALDQFAQGGLESTIARGVEAAWRRSKELGE